MTPPFQDPCCHPICSSAFSNTLRSEWSALRGTESSKKIPNFTDASLSRCCARSGGSGAGPAAQPTASVETQKPGLCIQQLSSASWGSVRTDETEAVPEA